jgi:N-hydroxyarylamine O-acetyltransferase
MTATAATFDLDAYLARIGWKGSTAPTYETLAGILGAHMAAIPFENLDVLLGRGVRLDLEGLQAKLVVARRGGYCFEHASLLKAALERLGFRPVAHAARVVLFVPRTEAPRTHMLLTVPLPEGTFVLDPGFGGLAPRVPVPLVDGAEARWGAELHRMVRDGDAWVLRAQRGPDMVDAWVTMLSHENPIDFELANFYTHASPRSPFTSRLMLRALTPDGRVSVMNRDVTITRGPESTTSRLADRAELHALLARSFGFDLPDVLAMKVGSEPEWA